MTNTGVITGAEALQSLALAEADYAEDFLQMIDTYHAMPEKFDDDLMAEYHRMMAEAYEQSTFPRFGGLPYFSPSSADSCPRELYVKVRKDRKDKRITQPHQGRWTRHGTAIGDSLQTDLLFIEKHYEDMAEEKPAFTLKRTKKGYPAFEDFAKVNRTVEAPDTNGEIRKFKLFGKPDGILTHHATGNTVGLEIKSKQTTAQQTGHYKMREPQHGHWLQCVTYGIMYDISDYLIVYLNGSKKNWFMDEEDYAKNPDIRAFYVPITQEDKDELLRKFADIIRRVEDGDPPKLDLSRFTFNNYKQACALDLSREELAELEEEVAKVEASSKPEFIKRNYRKALDEIKAIIREETE